MPLKVNKMRPSLLSFYVMLFKKFLPTFTNFIFPLFQSLGQKSVFAFLSSCLDPPDIKIIQATFQFLRDMQAIKPSTKDNEEEDVLTPLGYHLAYFPLDPQCAKLLILGATFSCLQPALAVAACLTFKDPFDVPFEKEEEADRKKREFADNSRSDHWAFYMALKAWVFSCVHCILWF